MSYFKFIFFICAYFKMFSAMKMLPKIKNNLKLHISPSQI